MLFKGPKSLLDSITNVIKEGREQYNKEQAEMNKLVAEKMLSPKQKKIAAVAGHPGKIDAADFHALRTGKQVKEASDMPEKPFKYNKKTGTFDRVKKMEEEVDLIDEISKETKKDFKARQERLAAASAQTAKDPARLARLSKIPGYTAAMDLAKKTTQKEEVEQVYEAVKPLESHDITSLAKMHAQHVLRQEGASVARPKHSFKDVSDTIKKKYGNTVHKLVGLHSENTVDDYTGSIHGSDSHNLRNKINSTLKKNRSSESIQHEPFNKLTRSEFNEERDTPGNGREHQCAIHVKSEQFGEGKTLTTQHADPDEYGNIAWYDVMFEHGIERVMTKNLEILVSEAHTHMKKKGVSAGTTAESRDVSTSQRQRQAHQHNLDAAQREMDRREAEGEDMTGAKIDPKNYQIIKPKKKVM